MTGVLYSVGQVPVLAWENRPRLSVCRVAHAKPEVNIYRSTHGMQCSGLGPAFHHKLLSGLKSKSGHKCELKLLLLFEVIHEMLIWSHHYYHYCYISNWVSSDRLGSTLCPLLIVSCVRVCMHACVCVWEREECHSLYDCWSGSILPPQELICQT